MPEMSFYISSFNLMLVFRTKLYVYLRNISLTFVSFACYILNLMAMQLVVLCYFNINFVHLYNLYEFIVLLFMRRLCRYSPDDSTSRKYSRSAISSSRRGGQMDGFPWNWQYFSRNFVKFGKIRLYFLSLFSYFPLTTTTGLLLVV